MLRILTFLLVVVSALGAQLDELEINTRIVNGTEAGKNDYPYMVSVRWEDTHKFGGTIINECFVLTAAHAVSGYNLSVEYGSTELGKGEVVSVLAAIRHGGYLPRKDFLHNIALLKLEKPLVLSDTVKTVNLTKTEDTIPSGLVTIAGWGKLESAGTSQTKLHAVNLSIISKEECESFYKGKELNYSICAGYWGGGKGPCDNDGGGPLIADGTQVGIISWSSKPCALPKYPAVFTKVAHYIEWINNLIKNANC